MATEAYSGGAEQKRGKRTLFFWTVAAVAVLGGLLYLFAGGKEQALSEGTTFTVTRGPLEITVLEGGSIEAAESQEIRSEVQGMTKILRIVDEGELISAEDVAEGRVLVELDATELQEKLVEARLQYENAQATLTEAREEYGIQVNQNESDLKAAELAVQFAHMDLEKYLGEGLARTVVTQVETQPVRIENPVLGSSEREVEDDTPAAVETPAIAMESTFISAPRIDFSKYADPELLGDGEARQKLRTLENALVLAEEEVGLAQSQMEGTQRLFEREFVTRTELDNDEMKLKRQVISREAAETSKALFITYEFPKEAQELLSKYEEALRALERARRTAVSKTAQAEAKLSSAQARFDLQARRQRDLEEQIEKCSIPATRPGLVLYGGQEQYWREERIEEGASVRERQIIITIPDTTRMTVKVQVHESYVKRVRAGQKAKVRVDAFPEDVLSGEVTRIAVLPDSTNRWMSPDLKVYATTVTVDGYHDWLKPGMSAQAEILIERLNNVIQVPMQAVFSEGGEQVCYVPRPGGPERRVVEAGAFSDSMIEIRQGLQPGEQVLLRSPRRMLEEGADPEDPDATLEDETPETSIGADLAV